MYISRTDITIIITHVFENHYWVPPRNASVLIDICPYMSIIGYIACIYVCLFAM